MNCCQPDTECHDLGRRAVLGLAGAGLGLAAVSGLSAPAQAQVLTMEARDALSPRQIVDLILEGNRRFAAGTPQPRDWLAEQRGTATGQHPAAIFLSCVDSRAPVEVICDLGIGHAFNARVAGNAVNDDILGSMEFATALSGADPTIMLTGPTPATRKVLKTAGLTVDDIDVWELNEAFAAVVLKWVKDFDLPMDKVNVNGGAIAMGHPLGATGAMILGTVVDELERSGGRYGLVTLCIGGGMGLATIVERV